MCLSMISRGRYAEDSNPNPVPELVWYATVTDFFYYHDLGGEGEDVRLKD